jgi:hypothetical protein
MKVTADNYRLAEKMVLHKYSTETDGEGRFLNRWRVNAIEQHRKDGTDGCVMDVFTKDIENIVTMISENKLITGSNITPKKKLIKKPVIKPNTVSANPMLPATPENPDGLDLDWN